MRQRAKRDLIAIVGVIAILGVVIVVNYTYNIGALAEKKDKERRHWESERQNSGMEILKWHHMRATDGSLRKGPTFTEDLMAWNNKQVNLIGFMVPENEFREMKEFILLPLPIECYFCRRPPVHDVMMVQMEEGTSTMLYENPVLINGVLRLHEGANQKYFYSIEHAALAPAEEGARLERRYIEPEHMVPQHQEEVVLHEGIELSGDS
jgi:hypothetical protein